MKKSIIAAVFAAISLTSINANADNIPNGLSLNGRFVQGAHLQGKTYSVVSSIMESVSVKALNGQLVVELPSGETKTPE